LTEALRLDTLAAAAAATEHAAVVEPASTTRPPDFDGLLDAVRSIGTARTLGAILDTLADCAAREAGRAAVLLVRDGRFHGRRFAGFESIPAERTIVDIADEEAGVLADAMRAGAPVSGQAAGSSAAPAFAALPPDRGCVALPIAIGGQVIAMLYADQGAEAVPDRDGLNVGRLEVLASYAARCLEAQTALKAARALLDRLDGAAGPIVAAANRPTGAGDLADADTAAQRYARLLVSEIKLYHEPAVLAGRRSGDLATRLGDEIARARVLYEERVPPPVRRHADYFHAELVRTLADGDASLMALEA
jgi:hypothetical protein